MESYKNDFSLQSFSHNQKFNNSGIEFSAGQNGMLWGPYIPLESGDYICCFSVSDTGDKLGISFDLDVCADSGKKILFERSSLSVNEQGLCFNLSLPSSEDDIEFRLYHTGERETTISGFHIRRQDGKSMEMSADSFLINKSKTLFEDFSCKKIVPQQLSEKNVIILQTADAYRYSKMLDTSSIINKAYCKRWGLMYESFSGTIFGDKPFQAMYNRVSLLWFLLERGYKGWVLYLDADAVISDFEFDFIDFLNHMQKTGKYLVFQPSHEPLHPLYFFGNVNDGAFAINLSSPIVHGLILTWHSFYREYLNKEDYSRAVNWTDLLDDQKSLHRIIFQNRKYLQDFIAFEPIQHKYIFQALRSDPSGESGIDDIEFRIKQLTDIGVKNGVLF